MEEINRDLTSRLNEIESWKRRKDNAEYKAKLDAEREHWEIVEKLHEYNERIEAICTLATKAMEYGVKCSEIYIANHCGFFLKTSIDSSEPLYMFGAYQPGPGLVRYQIVYKNGEFHKCRNCSAYLVDDDELPSTITLKGIYKAFPAFEEEFYKWFDENFKN